MDQNHIHLVNLSNPQNLSIFSYTKSTLILDLHQHLTLKGDIGNVQIYFIKNQLFTGNLNCYLHKHIKESSIYYNFDVSQIQQQSMKSLSLGKTQENKTTLLSLGMQTPTHSQYSQGSQYQQKSEKLCQTDESFLQNNGNQQINQDQSIYELQSKILELTNKLKQKEEELQKTLDADEIQSKDLIIQNSKNEEIILDLTKQNDDLKEELTQLQKKSQLDQKKISNLQSKIEEIKIEYESKNFRTDLQMQHNNVSLQKQQGLLDNQQEIIILPQQKKEIVLLSFNDSTENYINKCGHMIEKNKLESLLIKAVMNNYIAKCETCDSNFSAHICQDIGMVGQNYLKLKSTLELSEMYNRCKALQKSNLSVITCENSSCKFFCFYQSANQYSNGDYSYCPNCLRQSVKNPKVETKVIQF